MDPWEGLQWLAMAVTLVASWLVGARGPHRRWWGFWVFVVSNALWGLWGWHAQAYALVLLQAGLLAMNIRGLKKNDEGSG